MALYRSSTRELALSELPPSLLSKLRDHAAAQQLSLDGPTRCWLTRSENPPSENLVARLFGRRSNPADPDPEHLTALVLHATQLLIGVYGEARGAVAMSLPLALASIGRVSELAATLGDLASEPGMNVTGFAGELGRPGSFFVKLGEDPAGEGCYRAVEAAVRGAKGG